MARKKRARVASRSAEVSERATGRRASGQDLAQEPRGLDLDGEKPLATGVVDRPADSRRAARDALREGLPKWKPLYALVPVALALLASINTLLNNFASDDAQQVLANTFIKDFRNLPLAFTTTVWSYVTEDIAMTMQPYFRPMFSVLFTITYGVFGISAWGWHLVNVLIHAAVALLVFVVVRELSQRVWVSAISAALFAVHPAHSESVAWISGVTDPLMALFLLPSFYFYLRYRGNGRVYIVALSLGFYFLALLSKETALALPLVVAYVELTRTQQVTSLGRRAAGVAAFPSLFLLPTAAYFLMRHHALGSILFSPGGPRYPLGPALASVPLVTVKYLLLMSLPKGYSYQHYTAFVETIKSAAFVGPLVALFIILGLIIWGRSRLMAFAAVWFIVTLAPALAALRQFDPEYLVQERYLYLPSIGFCLAVALGIEWLAKKRRAAALAVLASALVVWSTVYIKQNRVWHDSVTLFENCVATDPGLPMARVALAGSLFNLGRQREAEMGARAALDLDSACANAYLNLSYFAHRSGKLDEAISYLERAGEAVEANPFTRPNLATVYLNLGLLYSQRKDMDRAEAALRRSIEIWPRPTAWFYAGQFYFSEGRYEEARDLFEQASMHVPTMYAPIHLSLAFVYERLGQLDRAKAEYQKYLDFAPPNAKERAQVTRRLSQL